MRTSILIVTLLLLGTASADLARRLACVPGEGPASTTPGPTRSAVIAATSSHERSIELEGQEGDTSVLLITFTPGPNTKLAEAVVEEAKLDQRSPIEALPCRKEPDGSAAIRIRLHFRDVRWSPGPDDKGYEAFLEHRLRVLYAGCDPADARFESARLPFRVEQGPALEAIRRRLGAK